MTACIEWTGALRNGYGCFRDPETGRVEYAHRRFYELFVGEIPEGMLVLHHCDNRKCVNPDHLHIGTKSDNAREAVERGLHLIGEKDPKAKLKEVQVRSIIREYKAGGVTQRELAKRYGVARTTINSIVNGYTWKHIYNEEMKDGLSAG